MGRKPTFSGEERHCDQLMIDEDCVHNDLEYPVLRERRDSVENS